MFEIFDLEFLPNMVPERKYWMVAPKGFEEEETDALLYRNASQYIVLSFVLLIIYSFFKITHIFYLSKKVIRKNIVNKIFEKVI